MASNGVWRAFACIGELFLCVCVCVSVCVYFEHKIYICRCLHAFIGSCCAVLGTPLVGLLIGWLSSERESLLR